MRKQKPVLEQIAISLIFGGLAMTTAFGFFSRDERKREEKEGLERGARIVSEEKDATVKRYNRAMVAGVIVSGAGIAIYCAKTVSDLYPKK